MLLLLIRPGLYRLLSAEEGAALREDAGTVRRPTAGSRRCSSCPGTVRGLLTGIRLPIPSCPPALVPEKVVLTALAIWDCQDILTGQQQNTQRRMQMPPHWSTTQVLFVGTNSTASKGKGAVRAKDLEKGEGPPTTRKRPRWRRRGPPRCGVSADSSPRRAPNTWKDGAWARGLRAGTTTAASARPLPVASEEGFVTGNVNELVGTNCRYYRVYDLK